MQIDLSESTERILEQKAFADGRSVVDYASGVLSRFASASAGFPAVTAGFVVRSHEDALLWVISRNPALQDNRPGDTEWQAIRSEGRRS